MRCAAFSRILAGWTVCLIVADMGRSVAADPASPTPTEAPPAIQPTPVKLPPPGLRTNATRPTGVRARMATNTANRLTSTNLTIQTVRSNSPSPKPVVMPDRFQRATVEEFDKLRTRPGAVVVDVRTAEEFADGHLPNAGLVDVKSKDFLAAIATLDRSKMYLVNCAAGGRSVRACQSFAALGFTNVVNLDGGFNAWKQAKPDAISKDPAIALPKSPTPNMQKSGTETNPPAARAASTNKYPVFKAPLIIKKSVPK